MKQGLCQRCLQAPLLFNIFFVVVITVAYDVIADDTSLHDFLCLFWGVHHFVFIPRSARNHRDTEMPIIVNLP